MKNRLYSLLIAFAFVVGFQSIGQAQMTVINQSGCTIYTVAIQEDMTTRQRCDWCGISSIVAIAPGSSFVFQRTTSCGLEFWNSVGWGTNQIALTSQSMNPFYQGTCLPDVLNATCSAGGQALSASWVVTVGGGSVQVTIQ